MVLWKTISDIHIVEFVGISVWHQHVCEGPVILGYRGDHRMQLVFSNGWLGVGVCEVPSAIKSCGWGSDVGFQERASSPTEQ